MRSGHTEIALSPRDGFGFSSILDRRSEFDWIREPAGPGLWRLTGLTPEGERRVITSGDAGILILERSRRSTSLGFEGPEGIGIRVGLEAQQRDLLLLRLEMLTMDGLAEVERLDFPCLAGLALPPGDPALSYFAFPFEQGVLVRDPGTTIFANEEANFRLSGTYPGNWSVQFVAYGQHGGPGLYLASYDPLGCVKRFVAERAADGRIVFWVENHLVDPTLPGALPYPLAIGTYEGSWLDAARIYASWASKQSWCSRRELTSGANGRWAQSTPAWIWNRGRAAKVVPSVLKLSDYLGRPVALDWYWWHGNPYDTLLPEYLPPRDGEEAFREAIRRIHRMGSRCIAYINGRCCDLASSHFSSSAAVFKRSGEVEAETYCKYTGARLAVMCPATEYWKSEITSIVSKLVDYGLDGVYIDQVASAPPRLCFSAGHNHPRGGCLAWAEGNRALLSSARAAAKARNPEAMLCSEGCCEVYMDLLDAFLTLSPSFERMGMFRSLGDSWEPIPMFNSVYHQFVVTFGSYASLGNPPYDELWPPRTSADEADLSRFTDQFDLEVARCLVFGQKPMIANFEPGQLKRAKMKRSLDFFREVCMLHERLEDHLVRGRYLGSPEVSAPPFKVRCFSKGIYTLPGQSRTTVRTVPSILASAWEAPDGSVAVVLANISPRLHRVQLDLSKFGVTSDARLLRIEPRGGAHPGRQLSGRRITVRGKHVVGLKAAEGR